MKIAVSSQGPELSSLIDPRFGRAAYFVIYDLDSGNFRAIENLENAGAMQGAGVQSAQVVAREGVDFVVSGNMGPKAFEALNAAGVQIVTFGSGTVAEAVEYIQTGKFKALNRPNVQGHWR